MSATRPSLELETDVLVLGGGPAGAWTALGARRAGARTVLADKGFCGTSGVMAAASAVHWWVPEREREAEMARRWEVGGGLSSRGWMERVMAECWRTWSEVAEQLGHPLELSALGDSWGAQGIEGPVYLRELRRRVSHAGARILDHSPALELLCDDDGAVCGADGWQRQRGRPWRVVAGAVVLATGGCAWKSGSLGSNVDTGDGHLMAAEVGARFSGMEFSTYYGVVPKGTAIDKTGYYPYATFTDGDGETVAEGWSGALGAVGPDPSASSIVRAGLRGPVHARLDRVAAADRALLRAEMPNFFMVFDRLGIDPFTQRFELDFLQEGLVRGSGGLELAGDDCSTGVPGLWAAGDIASRERLVGGSSGAGSPNSAWTISSGLWAGASAATHALGAPARASAPRPAGVAGLRATGADAGADGWRDALAAVQAETLPIARNGIRDGGSMAASQARLDALWSDVRASLAGTGAEALRTREVAAMLAVARWGFASALARTESRVTHVRDDFPLRDDAQRHHVISGGLDEVATATAPAAAPVREAA